ncbi:MAG: amidohydrolase [Nitrospinota bacterium]|nr:MAG: amidohydrolase [Nitrospinota bacterium]
MKIDFHNHFFPPEYLTALADGNTRVIVKQDDQGNPLLFYAGDYNILVPGHRDIEYRLRELDRCGVDMQVLSMTTPGVHIEEPGRGVELARIVNDAFARIMQRYPDRFVALAALPLQDPAASVKELERAVQELGLRGATLFTNINGQPLKMPDFWPLYEKAAELDVPLFFHPTSPVGVEAMEDFRLTALVGFPLDTTLAVARLVFQGVLEKLPSLKLVISHLGGAIPYLAERIDRGYEAYTECREHISAPPSHYFSHLYLDTVAFHPNSLLFALEFVGREQLLLGSDYPHQIGDLPRAVRVIEELSVPQETKEKILGQNAAALLGIKV